jgi:RNA polymerase sigma-70 factor (ECF subfamily)
MEVSKRIERLSPSDRDLVVAFKEGDEGAYDEIYRRHSAKIRVVCSRRLSHDHDAEEALQETFLRAYQALPRFNGQYKLGPWLNRIAINVCIDQLRFRSRAEIVRDIEESALEAQGGPEELLAASRPEVMEALNELKPLHARALTLQAVEGMSHHELAGTLAMTPGQVKSLLHRARLSFKRVMKGAGGWLAPIPMFRRRDAQGVTVGGGAVQTLGVFAAMHSSLPTAERALTGVVAAALALSAGGPAPSTVPRHPRQPAVAVPERAMDAPSVKHLPARSGENETSGPLVERVSTSVLDVEEVLAPLEKTVERVHQKLAEHERGSHEATLSRPSSLESNAVHDHARRKMERAEQAAIAITQVLTDI